MNIQFAAQFLREDFDEFESVKDMLLQSGASEDTAIMLANAVAKGHIEPSKAIEIVKNTTGLSEDGGAAAAPAGGGSTTGGGVTNGATFTPGTGEQYAAGTRKKKYQEDAPRLAGSPAKTNKQGSKNLNAYSSVGFTKAPSAEEAGKHIKGVEVKELWEGGDLAGIPGTVTVGGGKSGIRIPTTNGDYIYYVTDDEYNAFVNSGGNAQKAMATAFLKSGKAVPYKPIHNPMAGLGMRKGHHIDESRAYSQFKRETATRNKPDQLHEAAKMIHEKLDEITRLLEFTSQMRTELSEGEENLEYKHNTKKVFEKIHSKVVEVYTKVKGLK